MQDICIDLEVRGGGWPRGGGTCLLSAGVSGISGDEMPFDNAIPKYALHSCACAIRQPLERNACVCSGTMLNLVDRPCDGGLAVTFVSVALASISAFVQIGQNVLSSPSPFLIQMFDKWRWQLRLQGLHLPCVGGSRARNTSGAASTGGRPQNVDFKNLKEQQQQDPARTRHCAHETSA